MTTINETAYPRIKPNMSQSELQSVYTPTPEDIAYVRQQRRRKLDQLALLVHIKLTQRLGYFLKSPDIPNKIISHISEQMKMRSAPRKYLSRFDRGGSRTRLKALVRRYLDIKLIESNDKTTLLLHKLSSEASEKKHEIADIEDEAAKKSLALIAKAIGRWRHYTYDGDKYLIPKMFERWRQWIALRKIVKHWLDFIGNK